MLSRLLSHHSFGGVTSLILEVWFPQEPEGVPGSDATEEGAPQKTTCGRAVPRGYWVFGTLNEAGCR